MSIQSKVNELNSLKQELKLLGEKSRTLRKRVKILEEDIYDYLEAKKQPGLKYKGVAILKETKEKRLYKKKSLQKNDSLNILKQHGIRNPELVLEKLLDARKGDYVENKKLKIKKYKS